VHDVALQNLPVVFALDRAGLVGGDGATHQGAYDISFLRCIPNLVLMAPADENECRQLLYTATTLPCPSAVRYPRGQGSGAKIEAQMTAVPVGKAELRREGRSGLAILVFGTLLSKLEPVAQQLDATLVNMRYIKPLDIELLRELAARHTSFITVEENAIAGGAGSAVAEALAELGITLPMHHIGIPDRFIEHGSRDDCLEAAGLHPAGLRKQVSEWWSIHAPTPLIAKGS
jgi:1-deoxy-D-xylulose-5-phosphate synthase